MFDKMMNRLMKKLLISIFKSIGEELESAARNEDDHSASQALYGVAHVFQSSDIEWEVNDAIPTDTQREQALLYALKEVTGVMEEYRDMPCDSLERRMLSQIPRAQAAIDRAEQKELDV